MRPFHDLPRNIEQPVHPLNLERPELVTGFLDDCDQGTLDGFAGC